MMAATCVIAASFRNLRVDCDEDRDGVLLTVLVAAKAKERNSGHRSTGRFERFENRSNLVLDRGPVPLQFRLVPSRPDNLWGQQNRVIDDIEGGTTRAQLAKGLSG